MAVALTNKIARLAAVDRFRRGKAGPFVVCRFLLDYDPVDLLVADAW